MKKSFISMNTVLISGFSVFCLLLLDGCVSMAPVSTSFESARLLDKGEVELMGNYSSYFLNAEDENGIKSTGSVNNNFGFRFGYGLAKKLDLKLRYEHLTPVLAEDKEQINGASCFMLSPRYGLVKNMLSGSVDAGFYSFKYLDDNTRDKSFFVGPRMEFTYPSGKNFDLTLSTGIKFFPSDSYNTWNLNLGCGISSDISKWSLRPEIGLIKDLDDFSYATWYTAGLALIINIKPAAKE